MEVTNYLGIYISKKVATVVCVGLQGQERKVLGCFSVSTEKQEDQNPQTLETLIAQGCAQRQWKFSEAAAALDCTMFMQHNVHSEFTELKQIAQTVRFDTEETLATDITEVVVAFKIISSDQNGSKLITFTAQRKLLSDMLASWQSNNIDPIAIEPDVISLSRFACQSLNLPQETPSLVGMISRHRGYFLGFSKALQLSAVRTFLFDPAQLHAELLAKEIPITTVLVEGAIDHLEILDSTGSMDYQQVSEKLGIKINTVELTKSAGVTEEILSGCADVVDFAIAYGAALAYLEKINTVNFRNDFMPYQGKKIQMQKALKFLSVSVCALIFAVGLYFQMQLWQKNKYRNQLYEKLDKQYSAVMFGKKLPPKSDPAKKLAGELRRIKDIKSGQLSASGEESVSTRLELILEAFSQCAKQTNLKIDSISVTTKSITITGDTSSRKNTLDFLQAIRTKLDVLQESLDTKGDRDNFRITVAPKK